MKPVVVAVIDSGINYNHEQFCGKYDENGVAVSGDGIGEYDVLYRDESGNLIGKNTVLPTDKTTFRRDIACSTTRPIGTARTLRAFLPLLYTNSILKIYKIMPVKAAYPTGSTSTFQARLSMTE